ncbi:MAG TPA: endonuclease/exonuclease/phosphatase family protein, partial [Polyangiaceae bacterium]|nr:endonuclease/exonuclease/phosphatase family protein [Polyangiaceae bacterium]
LSGTVPLAAGAIAGELRAAPRRLAIAFGLGGLLLLLLVAAQILTTIYDYVPVVGSLFRNRFWIVTALPALGLAASTLLVRTPPSALPRGALAPLLALAVLGIAGSRVTEPAPAETAPVSKQSLRVVSYNIQQGYAKDGRKDLDAQLALIKELDADVVGLQECDTSRLAGGNADTVRYLANALGMHAYYGPSPPAGTFGVAVLSRHPITAVATHYLESTGEQTVLVVADVAVGQKNYSVAVTHLGNDGPLVQQQNVLAALPERGVILMGDFNFVPGSPQHRLTLAKLADAWDTAGEGERRPDEIDHLFVSRDLRVRAMRYRREPASDHPALFGEL